MKYTKLSLKLISNTLIIILFILTLMPNLLLNAEGVVLHTVTKDRNYLLVDVDYQVDLATIEFDTGNGKVKLSDVTLNSVSAEVTINENKLTATSKGVNIISVSYNEINFNLYIISKNTEDTSYIVYDDNFNNYTPDSIPDEFQLVSGNGKISDQALVLDARQSPSIVLFPSYLQRMTNYIVEADFTILEANEPTRWGSLMYRYNTENYYQMCIRQAATNPNGVEFAKRISGNWNVPLTISYKENIDASKMYRLKVDVNDAKIDEYIDNEKLITYENAYEYSRGKIGVQANGSMIKIDNVKVELPVEYVREDKYSFSTFPNLNNYETGIYNKPTIIKQIRNEKNLRAIKAEARANTVIFNVNSDLNIIDEEGNSFINIFDALLEVDRFALAAFRVEDTAMAVGVANLLKDYKALDSFIISKDGEALKAARETFNMVRTVLEIEYDETKPTLTNQDLIAIRDNTNMSKSIITLLPQDYATKDNVFFLQKRLITVWTNTNDIDKVSNVKAILSGAQGIVTISEFNLFTILQSLTKNALTRRPLIIAHRGFHQTVPENSIEGAQLALDVGVDAIENDIYLTKDNKIVVMHDTTTGRTANGNLEVENSTLDELKALQLVMPNSEQVFRIPTLEEYFELVKGTDVMLFVEIKSTKTEIWEPLKDLIEQYDIADQIVFISFHANQLNQVNIHLPHISKGLLDASLIKLTDIESSLTAVVNATVPLNATINPNFSPLTREVIHELNHRGISLWPWTITKAKDLNTYYTFASGGITSDNPAYYTSTWTSFEINNQTFNYTFDKNKQTNSAFKLETQGKISTQLDNQYEVKANIVIFDTGNTGVVINNQNEIISTERSGIISGYACFDTALPNGEGYTLYSELITINVNVVEEKKDNNNNLNVLFIIGSSVVGLVTIVGLVILIIKKLKA